MFGNVGKGLGEAMLMNIIFGGSKQLVLMLVLTETEILYGGNLNNIFEILHFCDLRLGDGLTFDFYIILGSTFYRIFFQYM